MKMPSNNIIKFLVNKEQLARIKYDASEQGHKTISSYLRELSLNQETALNKVLLKLFSLECTIKQMKEAVQDGKTQS